MNVFVLFGCMILIFLMIMTIVCERGEHFMMMTSYLDHKSKCFDCEQDIIRRLGPGAAWMAQPSKSFDAEGELLARMKDIRAGYGAKTLKYY